MESDGFPGLYKSASESLPFPVDIQCLHVHVPNGHGHSGLLEGRVDIVDRNWVKRVRRVAAHIDDHPQPTSWTSSIDLLVRHERGYLRAQVNAVDEDVNV